MFRKPPPRVIPGAIKRAAGRHYRIVQKYAGIALTCFGCFYTSIFAAMNAPREILLGFGSTGVLGIMLLVFRAFGKQRILKLLKMGTYVEGELIALAKPEAGMTGASSSYEILYRFRDQMGREWKGRTWIGWRDQFESLTTGDAVPICCNPSRPRQNISLFIIPPFLP